MKRIIIMICLLCLFSQYALSQELPAGFHCVDFSYPLSNAIEVIAQASAFTEKSLRRCYKEISKNKVVFAVRSILGIPKIFLYSIIIKRIDIYEIS